MYSDTITLFNRYHSRLGDIWFPHVISGVNLVVDKSANMAKYGAETTDKANLHVKYKTVDGKIMIGELDYVPSKEWLNLVNDELANHITFNNDANYWDFFILGDYDGDGEPINDDQYVDGLYSEMESLQECYVLSSVSSPYKVIPHFEITAR